MPWVRLDDGFDDHEKVVELFAVAGDNERACAALGLHMLALTYCGRKMTNGVVTRGLPAKLGGPEYAPALLVEARLWETRGTGWLIHDFLDFNPSREEVQGDRSELSRVRAEAGRKGAEARWARDGKKDGKPDLPSKRGMAKPAPAKGKMAKGWQDDSPEPEPEPGTTSRMDSASPSSVAAESGQEVERPEVVALCEQMADALAAQGVGKRPDPHTKKWHDATRRLLDLDGATVKQVEYAIRWTTAHTFWASVVRSMPKLREKWGSIALQIRQEKEGIRRGGGTARDRAGADMRDLADMAEQLREQGQ